MTTVSLRKNKLPSHLQKTLDRIIYELEQYGRAISNDGRISQFLSFRFKKPRDSGDIYFTWSKRWKKSIIVLSPTTQLIRVSENKVKLIKLSANRLANNILQKDKEIKEKIFRK